MDHTLSSPLSLSSSISFGDALLLGSFFGGCLPEGEQLGIVVGVGLGFGDARAFERLHATRALKDDGRDEALNLRRLRLGLFLSFLQLQGSSDDVLTNVVVFVQIEQLTDLAGSLGTEPTRDGGVGQTRNICFALLNNDEVEDGEIGVDDAASDAPAVKPCLSLPPPILRT